jgi:hypothetical protein
VTVAARAVLSADGSVAPRAERVEALAEVAATPPYAAIAKVTATIELAIRVPLET